MTLSNKAAAMIVFVLALMAYIGILASVSVYTLKRDIFKISDTELILIGMYNDLAMVALVVAVLAGIVFGVQQGGENRSEDNGESY